MCLRTYWGFFWGKSVREQKKPSVEISHLPICAYAVRLFYYTGILRCICSTLAVVPFEMWSGVNINISLLVLSPQRTEGAQTSGRGTDRRLQSAVGVLRLLRQTTPPHTLLPVTLETWETPICLRLVRVNRINPCPSRFKAEPARRRLILRLPSSIRQLGRNAQATLPPPLFLGKMKRPLHVWIFIRANETLCKLAEWSHLGTLLRDDNNHRHA